MSNINEAIAEITSASHDNAEHGERGIRILRDFQHLEYGTKLYAHPAQCLHQIQEPSAAEQAAWHAGLDEGRAQAAPAAVAVPDERAAFEKWWREWGLGGIDVQWEAWQARAALAATPAADAQDLDFVISPDALRTDDLILVPRGVLGSACHAISKKRDAPKTLAELRRYAFSYLPPAAGPVVLPEPVAWMATPVMQSGRGTTTVFCSDKRMADQWDYGGHPEYGRMLVTGLFTEQQVRALLAQAAIAAAPAHPAEGVQAVEQGEVLVTVSGFTGCGKSAIAGEIEIMCRALGLQVEWPDGDPEKNLTHADWTEALELYKPRVRIVECNVPHPFVKGQDK